MYSLNCGLLLPSKNERVRIKVEFLGNMQEKNIRGGYQEYQPIIWIEIQ